MEAPGSPVKGNINMYIRQKEQPVFKNKKETISKSSVREDVKVLNLPFGPGGPSGPGGP